MNNITYTTQELQSLKFYELPNGIYNCILSELRKQFGGSNRKDDKYLQQRTSIPT